MYNGMSTIKYNKELAKRFVDDYRLPVSLINDKYFFHQLELYERDFNTLTKWKHVWNMIDDKYNGNCNLFLEDYYNVRENIIQTVLNSEAYKAFNEMDMKRFEVKDKPNVSSNNIYNCDNIGKFYLSIDLKKANFQALRYVNPEIILNTDTYEEFIGKFTDLDYVKESKYSRQVIFGKMNPKRHITVEKYLINEVWKVHLQSSFGMENIVSMSNDEIVVEVEYDEKTDYDSIAYDIEKNILRKTGLKVRAEFFHLKGYRLSVNDGKEHKPRNPFFVKEDACSFRKTFVCVPLPYHAIVYKLYNDIPLEDEDYHFVYEGIDCVFNEDFIMEEIDNEWK